MTLLQRLKKGLKKAFTYPAFLLSMVAADATKHGVLRILGVGSSWMATWGVFAATFMGTALARMVRNWYADIAYQNHEKKSVANISPEYQTSFDIGVNAAVSTKALIFSCFSMNAIFNPTAYYAGLGFHAKRQEWAEKYESLSQNPDEAKQKKALDTLYDLAQDRVPSTKIEDKKGLWQQIVEKHFPYIPTHSTGYAVMQVLLKQNHKVIYDLLTENGVCLTDKLGKPTFKKDVIISPDVHQQILEGVREIFNDEYVVAIEKHFAEYINENSKSSPKL